MTCHQKFDNEYDMSLHAYRCKSRITPPHLILIMVNLTHYFVLFTFQGKSYTKKKDFRVKNRCECKEKVTIQYIFWSYNWLPFYFINLPQNVDVVSPVLIPSLHMP